MAAEKYLFKFIIHREVVISSTLTKNRLICNLDLSKHRVVSESFQTISQVFYERGNEDLIFFIRLKIVFLAYHILS